MPEIASPNSNTTRDGTSKGDPSTLFGSVDHPNGGCPSAIEDVSDRLLQTMVGVAQVKRENSGREM